LTPEQRDKLQDDYIHQIIDDMDLKSLTALACDFLNKEYDIYTTEELITDVKEYYPELLENEQESQRH
tara:strand:- start:7 stop:210 length:204 start_codon:yes stop_codon:yes gene_type:complete